MTVIAGDRRERGNLVIMDKFKEGYVEIDGYQLKLTNLDKVFWSKEAITKRDLIYYYYHIADYLIPHLKERPLTLKRYPDGIEGGRFFQKNAGPETPQWMKTRRIYAQSPDEYINYIFCNNRASLIYLANLAAISQNPWLSHWPTLDNPDFFVLDLDPQPPATFKQAIMVAHLVKEELENFDLRSWVKTSGATGLHVYVPIKPVYSYKQARTFAQLIATLVNKRNPKITTIEHAIEKRKGKVYIDYLQNVRSKTVASVYSVRARPKAPVSTSLQWSELSLDITPEQFNIFNIFDRLKEKGDIFKEVLGQKQDLSSALSKAQAA